MFTFTADFRSSTAAPGLEILTEPTAEAHRQQLRRAQLDGLAAPTEVWIAKGSNRANAYATHGLFRYFGKFPPSIAAHLIHAHTRPGDTVADLMAGCGTTGVECVLANRRAVLRDVNPLALLLSRVKTRYLPQAAVECAVAAVGECYRPLSPTDDPFVPVGLKHAAHWFLPATMDSLRGLRRAIFGLDPGPIRDACCVALAATVRRVSRATTQQGRLFLDADSAVGEAWPIFSRRAEAVATAVGALPPHATDSAVDVAPHDLRHPAPEALHRQADLVILHPPYFNAYRYSSVNALEMAWLGHAPQAVVPAEVREFFKVGKAEKAEFYVADMVRAVTNAAAVVRPGGVLAVMIGDTIIKGEFIPITRRLLDALCREVPSLALQRLALRVPRFTEATWVASQRRSRDRIGHNALADYVLTWQQRP